MTTTGKRRATILWRWRLSSALVMLLSVALLTYFCFTQATLVFMESHASVEEFQSALAETLLKSALLVVVLGIFVSFFATQEYQVLLSKIFKNLTANRAVETAHTAEAKPAKPSFNLSAQSFIDAINTQKTSFNELAYVEHSLENILENNSAYRRQLEQQQELLKETYLIQLMTGWNQETSEAYSIGSSLGIELQDKPLQVLLFGVDTAQASQTASHEEIRECYLSLQEFLTRMLDEQYRAHVVELEGLLACLILSPEESSLKSHLASTELFRITWLVRQYIAGETDLPLRAAVGTAETGVDGVAVSYAEALKAYDYARMIGQEGGVSKAHETSIDLINNETMSHWFEYQMQFLNCTKAEDFDGAYAHFSALISSDYARNAPTIDLAKHRMLELINLLISAEEEIAISYGLDNVDALCPQDEILSCVSLQALNQCAAKVFSQAGYYLMAKKSSSAYERMSNLTEYILENYRNPDLNVSSLALQFNLNPSYLSRTYKSMMQVGLSDFIQNLRVREAEALMRETNKSIAEISELAGFSNPLAMNRAFKKLRGATPTNLRRTTEDR